MADFLNHEPLVLIAEEKGVVGQALELRRTRSSLFQGAFDLAPQRQYRLSITLVCHCWYATPFPLRPPRSATLQRASNASVQEAGGLGLTRTLRA